MKITEWFARAVAAGLMPDWKNIIAYWSGDTANVYNDDTNQYIETGIEVDEFDYVQLRKDGVDLYSLEWRKPTGADIGNMCWLLSKDCFDNQVIIRTKLLDEDFRSHVVYQILTADHGQICPTIEDFEKVYGETI